MKSRYVIDRICDFFPGAEAQPIEWRLRQSTFVSLRKRYMYFEVPKAACTQMKHLLRRIEGAGPIKLFNDPDILEARRDLYVHDRSNVPLPSLIDLEDGLQREVLESPDFLRMTVVRNPYTRLASAWRNKVFVCDGVTGQKTYLALRGRLPQPRDGLVIPFDEFIRYVQSQCDLPTCDLHWRRQVEYTYYDAMNFSFVGKVEQLREALTRLEHHIGLSQLPAAERTNESLPIGTVAYNEELAETVYAVYKRDFEVLCYDRDSWLTVRGNETREHPSDGAISLDRLRDEIIERNLVILGLNEERHRLQTQLERVTRLRLLPIVDGLASLRARARKLVRNATGWLRGSIELRPPTARIRR